MKLKIETTTPGLYRDDDVFAFVHRGADGEVHVLELTERAQGELVMQLLAARMNKPKLNLFPKIVKAAPLENGMIGVLLSISETNGLYFGLTEDSANDLHRQLEMALTADTQASAA